MRFRVAIAFALVVLLLVCNAPGAYSEPTHTPLEILVKFKTEPHRMQPLSLPEGWQQARPDEQLSKIGVGKIVFEAPRSMAPASIALSFDEALEQLRSRPDVLYAVPNYTRQLLATYPDDPFYDEQWYLNHTGLPAYWYNLTLPAVVVAVVDSGVNHLHADLAADSQRALESRMVQGRGFVRVDGVVDPADTWDNQGHGTMVAGILAAHANNEFGITGMTPNALIMPLKVFDYRNGAWQGGDDASIAAAIVWAADNGARIINLSLGGPQYSEALRDAVQYARANGAITVAATGNDGYSQVLYPAAFPEVIAVGALAEATLQRASFSNYGPEIDVLAPGQRLVSLSASGGVAQGGGTSYATAVVSAAAALMAGMRPEVLADITLVQYLLEAGAITLGEPGWDAYNGWGRIDVSGALELWDEFGAPVGDAYEPNDTPEAISAGHPARLVLSPASHADDLLLLDTCLHLPMDVDFFKLEVGQKGWLRLNAGAPQPLQPELVLTDFEGEILEYVQVVEPEQGLSFFRLMQPGAYFVEYSDVYGRWSASPYGMDIAFYPVGTLLTSAVPERPHVVEEGCVRFEHLETRWDCDTGAGAWLLWRDQPAVMVSRMSAQAPGHARVVLEFSLEPGEELELVFDLPYGDLNADGVIDLQDLAIAAASYGSVDGDARYALLHDARADGMIDLYDLVAIGRNLNLGTPSP